MKPVLQCSRIACKLLMDAGTAKRCTRKEKGSRLLVQSVAEDYSCIDADAIHNAYRQEA